MNNIKSLIFFLLLYFLSISLFVFSSLCPPISFFLDLSLFPECVFLSLFFSNLLLCLLVSFSLFFTAFVFPSLSTSLFYCHCFSLSPSDPEALGEEG